MIAPLLETHLDRELGLECVHRGKVRDIYRLEDGLLMVATDRLSAFDVVFEQGVPQKGAILTQLSRFWSENLESARPFHVKTFDVEEMPLPSSARRLLTGRTMWVEPLKMLPVECVVRAYLMGSGFKEYAKSQTLGFEPLPKGLQIGDPLPELVFTPATKAAVGDHDENIPFAQAVELAGEVMVRARDRSLKIFAEAQTLATSRGLVLVDTKFEFGETPDGTLVLADEILTPDSSRYWDLEENESTAQGQTPASFDKQGVRDFLETLDWNKAPPAPALPKALVEATTQRYRLLYQRLTNQEFHG